jgi:L-threonylcarbamoyladenylate synthase
MNVLTSEDAAAFESAIGTGKLTIFPTDTLYGIACDPDNAEAIERIHQLKGRPPKKPSAVMYFSLEAMLSDLEEWLDAQTLNLAKQLFPGPFTLIVANRPELFTPSCADTPRKLGLRVPALGPAIEALAAVRLPVMQTSANVSGGPDVTAVEDIDPSILEGVDLVLDGGPVLGYGSTVADVSELTEGRWRLLRGLQPRTSARLTELIGFPPEEAPTS